MTDQQGDQFQFAATGDAMITRELQPRSEVSAEFDALLDLLRGSTVTATNLEMVLHDYDAEAGVYAHHSGGTYMRAPPKVLDELTAMGCDVFTAAQNHAFDYGYGGALSTIDELESRELTYAGLGSNLFEARRPGYYETPVGRVAVLSATSRFGPGVAATSQSEAMHGSPGVNPLHVDSVYRVPNGHLEQLQETSRVLNIEDIKREWIERGHRGGHDWLDDDYFHFMDMKFETVDDGDEPGIYYDFDEEDATAIQEWIDEANRTADWVIMGFHSHASALGYFNKQTTPKFVQTFARQCVDAGADIVVGTGPHKHRGMELYDDRPIFYSLGNFIDQREYIERFPPDMYDRYDIEDYAKPAKVFDARWTDEEGNPSGDLTDPSWWRSVVPVCTFNPDGDLARIELHPISLQRDAGRPQRGTPIRATGETAADVLEGFAELSEPFGTEIDRDGELGIVEL